MAEKPRRFTPRRPNPFANPPQQADAVGEAPVPDEATGKMIRAKRSPVGSRRARLGDGGVAPNAAFVRRWVLDTPGNVEDHKSKAYRMVNGPDGKPIVRTGNRSGGGAGILQYLMEIPADIYKDRQDGKSESLDEFDQQIYGGHLNEEPGDRRYVPKGGINIRTGTGPGRG